MPETTQHQSAKKLEAMTIGQTTGLQVWVWRIRRWLRDRLKGKDLLDVETGPASEKMRAVYRKIDSFMAHYFPSSVKMTTKDVALKRLRDMIDELGYTVVDADETKPWGAYYRMDNKQAGRFIREFFPGLSLSEAKLGHKDVELSPKFLLVAPGQRLSWQYHHRRAERWRFLSDGAYYKSRTDAQGRKQRAPKGTTVQFSTGERHRLCAGSKDSYTLVAEIWQHTNPKKPSDEPDIVRLSDDYKRT